MTITTALLAVSASFAPLQQDSIPLPDTIVQLPEIVVSGTRSTPVPRIEQAASLTLTIPKLEKLGSSGTSPARMCSRPRPARAPWSCGGSWATRCCTWWTASP